MNVVVDVIHAVAVVADAFGAVAELQIRVVGIGAAADGTLVEIAGLLLLASAARLKFMAPRLVLRFWRRT